ncbi:alkaline phosphatase isoform X3 [Cherax quadricarinatus]|uniref:alkaline phosphatase isoform X3 n=1 Tax=Cherax quadricarinatus TaxID=27406 RepID=UPI00387EA3C9
MKMPRCVWCTGLVMLVMLHLSSAVIFPSPHPQETDKSYWYQLMRRELREARDRPTNIGKAKNVLFFLGDGMGVTVSTAGRILKGQKKGVSGEEGYLAWERFPNMALLKTYALDKQVPDSANTATAYLTGVKANYETLGVNGRVKVKDCDASLIPENRLDTILNWAQDAGKDTGMVTTSQVTHATPAALYAKSAFREWQCDTRMIQDNATHCKDIARQLVEDEPGKNMKVILGGGRQEMGAPHGGKKIKCPRSDSRNLVEAWKKDKKKRGASFAYVTSTRQLRGLQLDNLDYLMGLFGDISVPYEVDRDHGLDGTPSLKEKTLAAIRILKKSSRGFFLLVENDLLDKGLHDNKPRRGLEELLQMEEAVEAALQEVDLEDTLVVVTADHSHTMAMAGYPPRGNDIFGITTSEYVTDGLPYTTLMFTTGQGYNYTWDGQKVVRPNLTGVDTNQKDYVALAAVPTQVGHEAHGGEDVAVFAAGPMSHLFHRVHEQTYVAHVMASAACIGPYKNDCARPLKQDNGTNNRHRQGIHLEGCENHTDSRREDIEVGRTEIDDVKKEAVKDSAPAATSGYITMVLFVFLCLWSNTLL